MRLNWFFAFGTSTAPAHCRREIETAPIMQSGYPLLKKWTAQDHERLKALADAGRRPNEIASELNRSEAAVRVRAWQHGIALRLVIQRRKPVKTAGSKARM
ncbi:hypothetical protein [Bradyrhizobium sp. WSM2793]|uniref:hypothetical protein n=1 Tax=Bradyrhizobium sp. WSM2793 TaxID=1038866 RepID=UPI001FD894EC|nr:hypothetical protein [Bradyrhizobium sp. WSM2793]